ncbi:uncharacterized protein LOC110388780 isoform X2 [Numida meleagris]|uniref:uncharacterized protein LOC110388780 isoform X2 n=1 Tax=Numida meleagris TaxID=8996 RepID=UPI000B3E0A2F|nr:uncharacterized protein LOC110388780 isoform X2 [Numida meleagris]
MFGAGAGCGVPVGCAGVQWERPAPRGARGWAGGSGLSQWAAHPPALPMHPHQGQAPAGPSLWDFRPNPCPKLLEKLSQCHNRAQSHQEHGDSSGDTGEHGSELGGGCAPSPRHGAPCPQARLEANVTALRDEVRGLRRERAELSRRNAALQEELAQGAERALGLQQRLEEAAEQRRALRARGERCEERQRELEATLRDRAAELDALRRRLGPRTARRRCPPPRYIAWVLCCVPTLFLWGWAPWGGGSSGTAQSRPLSLCPYAAGAHSVLSVSLQFIGGRGGSFNICIPDGEIKTQRVQC